MNRKNHLLAILAAVSLILATLTGCGGKTEPDIPQPTQEPIEYANLTDEESRALLSRLLENAGIDETRIRGLFDRVDQFNASVKSEWLTNGFERAVPTDTKYDPYEMQDLWAEKNGDFPGYNCRITAFSPPFSAETALPNSARCLRRCPPQTVRMWTSRPRRFRRAGPPGASHSRTALPG